MIKGGTLALDCPVCSSRISTKFEGGFDAIALRTDDNFSSFDLAERSIVQMAFNKSLCLS